MNLTSRFENECFSKSRIIDVLIENNTLIKELPERFTWGSSISSIILPNSVEKIPYNTFACHQVDRLIINNSHYRTGECGTVYSLNPIGVVLCSHNYIDSFDFTGLEVIYGGAFRNYYLDHLEFDKTLRYVGTYAFQPPSKIKFHPESHIEKICNSAFSSNTSTMVKYKYKVNFSEAVIKLPRIVEEIGTAAFKCKKLVFPSEFECGKLSKQIVSKKTIICCPKSLSQKLAHLNNDYFEIIEE